MAAEAESSTSLLGFLVFEKTSDATGYIAALMVTDVRGYPLEFRATPPIRPSLVQRTLYGGQLENYIWAELCGKALVQNASRKPKIFLVPDKAMLELASTGPINIVAIHRAGESLKTQGGNAEAVRGTIEANGATNQGIVYEASLSESESSQQITRLLQECAMKFDLIEAFSRMRAAISLLGKEDKRFS